MANLTEKILPTKKQLEFQDWEFGVFFHFGIRTFYEGHKDWDGKEMPAEGFMPSELDCEEWIKTIKAAGAKYAVLTVKHHDGFSICPTKYSDYSVASSLWKDGKGDVVDEFVKACQKYDINVGLYYSPADKDMGKRKAEEHDDFFINQISEILTNYGEIDILWFDGCGSEKHEFDKPRIIKTIRSLQPSIRIFNMWDPDFRWVGNEGGIAPFTSFNTVSELDFSVLAESKVAMDGEKYLPVECDCRMREVNWFYSDEDEHTVKSLNELMAIYYSSIGRGANLLINIGPDRRGLLPNKDAQRLIEFGNEVKTRFANPIISVEKPKFENNICKINWGEHKFVNHIVIEEDLTQGESIKEFTIYIYSNHLAVLPIEMFKGTSVGHKKICRIETAFVNEIIIEIKDSNGEYVLNNITVHFVDKL
jgi:alpha-L-fucosidase